MNNINYNYLNIIKTIKNMYNIDLNIIFIIIYILLISSFICRIKFIKRDNIDNNKRLKKCKIVYLFLFIITIIINILINIIKVKVKISYVQGFAGLLEMYEIPTFLYIIPIIFFIFILLSIILEIKFNIKKDIK